MTNVLGHYNKPYSIQRASVMDLTLLRNGPVVVIGGFNNLWTRRLTTGLRFTFEQDRATQTTWIEDRKNKGMRDWQTVDTIPYTAATDDWAIVARFQNTNTEHAVLLAAGLKIWGTRAAREFVAKRAYIEDLAKRAPANWKNMNLEAVITTRVINGVSGPPHVVAVEFW